VAHVNRGLAMRARHLLVHFGNHDLRVADRRQRAVHRRAQAYKPVRVRRRNLHQHNIERQSAALEEAFDLAQKNRRVVGASVANSFAHVIAQKQAAMAEVTRILGTRVVGRAQRLHVDDFDVVEFGGPRHQRVHQNGRCSAA